MPGRGRSQKPQEFKENGRVEVGITMEELPETLCALGSKGQSIAANLFM